MEQEPGPRGSPQEPHGAGGAWVKDFAGVLDCAANTDISFCRSAPLQAGHAGDWPSRIRYSK